MKIAQIVVPALVMTAAVAAFAGLVYLARRRRDRCPSSLGGAWQGLHYSAIGTAPLVLLHGRGGSDVAFMGKVQAPGFYVRGIERDGAGWAWTTTDRGPGFAAELASAADDVVPFVEAVSRCYGRPWIAGHSQGGAVALLLAARHPELVSGVVAASTGLPRVMWTRLAVPAILVHGTADPVVSFENTQAMATATDAELRPVEGAGHELEGALLSAFVSALP